MVKFPDQKQQMLVWTYITTDMSSVAFVLDTGTGPCIFNNMYFCVKAWLNEKIHENEA